MKAKLLLTLLFVVVTAYANIGGLAFKSSDELINQRTSAQLNLSKMGVSGSFQIEFDVSIWNADKFGYIFSFKLPSQKVVNFVHVHYRNSANSHFELTIPAENKAAIISVPKNQLGRSHWIPIIVSFDAEKNEVSITCKDKQLVLETELENDCSKGEFVFGRSTQYIEVVRMAIRNLHITSKSNNKEIFIPLTQKEGTEIHDVRKRIVGVVENPCWLISDHLHWSQIGFATCHYNSGIAFDSIRQEVHVLSDDSVFTFSSRDEIFSAKPFEKLIDLSKYYREAVYNPIQDNIFVYHYGNREIGDNMLSVSKADSSEKYYEIINSIGKRHHHGSYFNPTDTALYVFGGYGSFSYYNKLTKLDISESLWVDIPLKGDSIKPRFFTTMGEAYSPEEVFVFGGFGNPSGKQEMGGFHFYDLFLVNLSTGESKKIADFKNQIEENFVPLNQLVYIEKSNEIYVLGFTHQQVNATLQLYRISLNEKTIVRVADTIAMMSEKIQSNAFLFHDEKSSQLLCVVKEWSKELQASLRIYSLASPPQNELELYGQSYQVKTFLNILLVLLTLLIAGFLVFWLIKRKYKHDDTEVYDDSTDIIEEHHAINSLIYIPSPNSVYTFGGFAVFDNKGKDITYRFSVRLKHFFALVLLNSYSERGGLTSLDLCTALWPDKDAASAQNLRGVTANQLRAILKDIDGITLDKAENGKWVIQVDEPAHCDYVQIFMMLAQKKPFEISTLISTLSNGMFFPHIQTPWIDKFKSTFEALLLEILPKEINPLMEKLEFATVVKLTNVLLALEPLNDEFFAAKLSALLKLGKTIAAKQNFESYKNDYKQSYGNPITLDMKSYIERYAVK
ncbi:MAG: hypothetical protein Q7J05_05605 [Paludibacter sp.]|nr:hypothetical protein [Paludibacter sp.]